MTLNQLRVRNVRILAAADLEFGSAFNLFTGDNGSGKTSVLEAIHLLAVGRSFLNRHSNRLIRHGEEQLSVYATASPPDGIESLRVGVAVDASGLRTCKMNGEIQKSMVAVAQSVPIFVLEPNSQTLVAGGPGERRRFLDRGLFHVEHEYQQLWSRYRKSLSQVNQLLRDNASDSMLRPWYLALAENGEKLDAFRQAYVTRISHQAQQLAASIAVSPAPAIKYRRGWREEVTMLDALLNSVANDRRFGAVSQGPHRADFTIRLADREAKGITSRGQTKRLVALLTLAQLFDYATRSAQRPILLFDDLASELDANSQAAIFQALRDCRAQVFANCLDDAGVRGFYQAHDHRFHVEHGQVTQVI